MNYYTQAAQEHIAILTHKPELTGHFKRLNMLWLREFFEVEPYDQKILDNPQEFILNPGGQIFYARMNDRIVGTGALFRDMSEEGLHQYEFTKMGVEPGLRGKGIGRKLLQGVVDYAAAQKADRVYILTNSMLAPATKLYRSMGFTDIALSEEDNIKYQRADTKLELWLNAEKKPAGTDETLPVAA
jgi:GNAT superfamily N-acetyltransferase